MKYYFHHSAKIELNNAVDYYEDYQLGLGREFAKEIYAAVHRIIQFPKAWPRNSVSHACNH